MILSSAHQLFWFHMTTKESTVKAGAVIYTHTHHAQNLNYIYWQGVWFKKL